MARMLGSIKGDVEGMPSSLKRLWRRLSNIAKTLWDVKKQNFVLVLFLTNKGYLEDNKGWCECWETPRLLQQRNVGGNIKQHWKNFEWHLNVVG
jgi:hypothetical protein